MDERKKALNPFHCKAKKEKRMFHGRAFKTIYCSNRARKQKVRRWQIKAAVRDHSSCLRRGSDCILSYTFPRRMNVQPPSFAFFSRFLAIVSLHLNGRKEINCRCFFCSSTFFASHFLLLPCFLRKLGKARSYLRRAKGTNEGKRFPPPNWQGASKRAGRTSL